MTIRSPFSVSRFTRGFTLIEVLIALVVLGTGLLALGALQASLARSSAESRARSQVAALLDLVIERQRTEGSTAFFNSVVPATWTPNASATVGTLPRIMADVQREAGVSNLSVTQTCTHFQVSGTGADTQFDADCVYTASQTIAATAAQYKRLTLVVTWTDGQGANKRMESSYVVSPRTLADSTTTVNLSTAGNSNAKRPVVRTTAANAGVTDGGIIPIAIGDGTQTAATNPRPEISTDRARTTFQVLTYATENSNVVQQRRVETAIIGCQCNKAASPPASTNALLGTAQWPAYWNGTRYTVFKPTDGAAPPGTTLGEGEDASVAQDTLCVQCCRDHHDTSTPGVVKFSPFEFAASGAPVSHYKLVNGALVEATGASDKYLETCRMIRVDGFWRVASDARVAYFNNLRTASDGDSPIPDSTELSTTGPYSTMVLGYLDSRFTNGATSGYNSDLASGTITGLETSSGINPDEITIARTNGLKWLHTRGLYVDFLEADAVALIDATKAKSSCSGSALPSCIRPLVPFTSVNTTELATYSSSSTVQLSVSNNGFSGSTLAQSGAQNPVRGEVRSGTNPTANTQQPIGMTIGRGNSALAAYSAVRPGEQVTLTDAQNFRIQGASPPDGTGGNFTVTLSPYTYNPSASLNSTTLLPFVKFTNTSASGVSCNSAQSGTGAPNPYTCTAAGLGTATTLALSNYNYESSTTKTPAGTTVTALCTNNKVTNLSCSLSAGNLNTCTNFSVDGVTNTGRGSARTASVSAGTVNAGDAITVALTAGANDWGTVNGTNFTCSLGNGKTDCSTATLTGWSPCK